MAASLVIISSIVRRKDAPAANQLAFTVGGVIVLGAKIAKADGVVTQSIAMNHFGS